MTDECVIGRDIEGQLDDVIDEETGEIVPPPNDESVIYTGQCMVTPAGIGQNEGAQGQPVELPGLRTYRGLIPVEVTDVAVHDVLLVTVCDRDADLVGRKFIVRGVKASTFSVARELTLEGEK